jgi:hypothetical protein
MTRLAVAERVAAGETARRRHDQPLAATARTACDVEQFVLEVAYRESEQRAQRVEGEFLAQQQAAHLLPHGPRRTDTLGIATTRHRRSSGLPRESERSIPRRHGDILPHR